MSKWRSANLSDLADIRTSNVDKKSRPGEQPVSLCNYMDVYSNDYIRRNLDFMEATASGVEIEKFKVSNGDVIITKDSETPYDIGIPTAVIEETENLVCGYHLALIKPNLIEVDSVFLSKQLSSVESAAYFSKVAAGSTRYGLSTGAIARTRINLPSLPTQQKIARILQTVDRAMEKTEALIEKYQQIKAGLMHDLFTRGLWTQEELERGDHKGLPAEALAKVGQLRPPRHQAPHLYQETPIGWIPKAWGLQSLSALNDSLVDGPFGSNLKSEHYVPSEGVRVIRLQNIQSTEYNDGERAFVSKSHAAKLYRNHVTGGDILIAGLGEEKHPVGRACLYPDSLPPAINKADCFRLRCNKSEMDQSFLMYFLNTEKAKHQVRKYEQGVTRCRINTGNMKRIRVPKPELSEQNSISAKLRTIQQRVDSEISNRNKLTLQKQGLMHDLLTGKVPVTPDPEPEEASDV